MGDTIPFSAACERNKDVILEVLAPYFSQIKSVLEIGSGTAQHAIHFAKAHPTLLWQTSDQVHYLDGIECQLKYANLNNVFRPLMIDVNQTQWAPVGTSYQAVYTANTFHIMAQSDVEAFFKGLNGVVDENAFLFIYGPFKYNGEFTSLSNHEFDLSLRSRGCGSAIRDFEFIRQCAKQIGFTLLADHKMPANNQLLIFQKQGE